MSALRVIPWSLAVIAIAVPVVFFVLLIGAFHSSKVSAQHQQDRAHARLTQQAHVFGEDLRLASTAAIPDSDEISTLARADHVQYVRSSVQDTILTADVISSAAFGTLFGAATTAVCFQVTITDAGSPSAQDEVSNYVC